MSEVLRVFAPAVWVCSALSRAKFIYLRTKHENRSDHAEIRIYQLDAPAPRREAKTHEAEAEERQGRGFGKRAVGGHQIETDEIA